MVRQRHWRIGGAGVREVVERIIENAWKTERGVPIANQKLSREKIKAIAYKQVMPRVCSGLSCQWSWSDFLPVRFGRARLSLTS